MGRTQLLAAYRSPGLAYQHTLGMLLGVKETLEHQILTGPYDTETGEDLSLPLRAALQVVNELLAIPDSVQRALTSMQADEEVDQVAGASTVPDWPDLLS